jgi:hypothetical protein
MNEGYCSNSTNLININRKKKKLCFKSEKLTGEEKKRGRRKREKRELRREI